MPSQQLADPREKWVFRLYIAGEAPNSQLAVVNFTIISREYLPVACDVEIIDILKDPLRALNDGILVTPILVKLSPLPIVKVVGNLTDHARVLQVLGLNG
jgi:circadian clock protein KaiB